MKERVRDRGRGGGARGAEREKDGMGRGGGKEGEKERQVGKTEVHKSPPCIFPAVLTFSFKTLFHIMSNGFLYLSMDNK